jgi:hypothetical protein
MLFNQSLLTGDHPTPFKTAGIVVIPKTEHRDRTLPKSYRPLASAKTEYEHHLSSIAIKLSSYGEVGETVTHSTVLP